jgi:hypothetical protein
MWMCPNQADALDLGFRFRPSPLLSLDFGCRSPSLVTQNSWHRLHS